MQRDAELNLTIQKRVARFMSNSLFQNFLPDKSVHNPTFRKITINDTARFRINVNGNAH